MFILVKEVYGFQCETPLTYNFPALTALSIVVTLNTHVRNVRKKSIYYKVTLTCVLCFFTLVLFLGVRKNNFILATPLLTHLNIVSMKTN